MQQMTFEASDGNVLYAFHIGENKKVSDPVVILLHGGGPDHKSLLPLGRQLATHYKIVLPDLRGYGKSVCYDKSSYTWKQYVSDLTGLIDHIGVGKVIIVGAGIGATVCLKAALLYPGRIDAMVLISIEDIEPDKEKQEEIQLLEAFSKRVMKEGIEAAWAPLLAKMSPVISTMVRDALPRSDAKSIAAAASIVYDRSFSSYNELLPIAIPVLIIPGDDSRHPAALAKAIAAMLPQGQLSTARLCSKIKTIEDFSNAFAPAVASFIENVNY